MIPLLLPFKARRWTKKIIEISARLGELKIEEHESDWIN